ncbi:hypothetical protein [Latilactobacillus fragifolii]|uniref:hypothetical protein n=1 Tax=Latilactobacillus fragifolii TaxID=2814244 RepID=UPI001ABA5963|nr:hypothetical protein [Latilactobacillus fragifolii]
MKKRLDIGVIFLLLVGIIAGCGANNFLKKAKVEFTGYNGYGVASIAEESSLQIYKEIARFEGKKANVDKKTLDSLIETADSSSDLYDADKFNPLTMKSAEINNAKNYIEHMEKTSIDFDKSSNLKNGETIKLTIKDDTTKPFFKPVNKTYKVKGLKKQKRIAVKDIKASDFKLSNSGTNTHGRVSLYYTGHGKTYVNKATDITSKKGYSNGDKIAISEVKLAKILNDGGRYAYYGRKGHNINLTVSGLKRNKPKKNPTNLAAVITEVQKNTTEIFSEYKGSKLVHAYLDNGKLYLDYRTPDNEHYEISNWAKIKHNKLWGRDVTGNQPLEKNISTDPIFSGKTDPYKSEALIGDNVIDLDI